MFKVADLLPCVHQQRIQGRDLGGRPNLFFDQNEARRVEKKFFRYRAPPLSEGLDLPLYIYLLHCVSL